ncbi:MAG TPA: hypothetical protein GX018_02830 [Bacteroidales bacterium]|jgi:hypothetical protein|nr:hypothetical protein [Bacteroidales bacterium]
MKKLQLTFISLFALLMITSCQGNGKQSEKSTAVTEKSDRMSTNQSTRRRGPDYQALKQELQLTGDQEKQYDALLEKYRGIQEAGRTAWTGADGKVDRMTMFEKMDELRKQQSAEMATILNEEQMKQYEAFTAQNRRRRPGYPDELMSRLKSELQLDESQWQMLKAVNKAFEKSYHDAHDFYHGNGELAREYWQRYDKERKNALKQLFNETQYEQYLEIVKDVTPQGGH